MCQFSFIIILFCSGHVAHHFFFTKVPHYHLAEATKAIRGVLDKYPGVYKRRSCYHFLYEFLRFASTYILKVLYFKIEYCLSLSITPRNKTKIVLIFCGISYLNIWAYFEGYILFSFPMLCNSFGNDEDNIIFNGETCYQKCL